jgi:trimethylamine:corrinoid methyltransferase-like protein
MEVKEPIGGQLEVLSKSDIEQIHGATMEVLRRLGVKVWSPVALRLFEDAGAEVNKKTMMAKLSEELVSETIHKDVLIQGDAFVKEVMRSYGH